MKKNDVRRCIQADEQNQQQRGLLHKTIDGGILHAYNRFRGGDGMTTRADIAGTNHPTKEKLDGAIYPD